MTYIDPGSGSMAFQVLVAGIAGFAIAFHRRVLGALRRLFRRGREDRS